MDEVDVVVAGERVEATAGQPFDDTRERERSGDQPGRGVERRIGGIEEAEVDFPFVPSACALHDVVRAVDERHRLAASRQLERGTGAEHPGAEHGDALSGHSAMRSVRLSARNSSQSRR